MVNRERGTVTVRRIVVAGAASVFAGLTIAAEAVFTAQHQPVPVQADPLTLFAELTPVLKHDRSANCHGATHDISWNPFVIDITGILPDPNDLRLLTGSSDFTIITAQTDRTMGIEAYGAASEIDGKSIPFWIRQSWDLRRRP